jgi:hypothetical protein
VIGEAGRLGSRGAERLNEPDTESSLAYGNVTFVKWGPHAAVVFSLMDRPAAETSVAARTLVQAVGPAPPTRGAPLVAQLQPQSEQTSVLQAQPSVLQAQRADGAGAVRPQGAAGVVHTGASSAVGAASTTQRPPIAAALASKLRE